jgi:hypothetical protein
VTLLRYAMVVSVVVAASLALVSPFLPPGARLAAVLGGLLAAANTLLAYSLATWAQTRSPNVFLGAVLGGMVGRMAFMLASVVGAVLLLGLPKVPLALSLLSYFTVFLVFELATLNRQTTTKRVA